MSDFIHHRWISPVKDGFNCVFSVKDNTQMYGVFVFIYYLLIYLQAFILFSSSSIKRLSAIKIAR